MKKIVSLMVVIAMVALVSCGGKGKTLVSINGKNITESDLEFIGTINPKIKAQLSTPFGKKQILDTIVEQELLYQAAIKKGLQREPQVKDTLEFYKKAIIGRSYAEYYMKKSAKEYYDGHKDEFEKMQLAHIEIKFAPPKDPKADKNKKAPPPKKEQITRSKDAALKLANEIKARLDKGEEFAKVAKEVSEDSASKNNGGDLGKTAKSEPRLERRGFGPLLEKAFTIKVGEIAGPIESKEGFHIITVTKGAELQTYEEVEQSIVMKVQNEEKNKLMEELKKDAKVVFPEDAKKKKERETRKAAQSAPGIEGEKPAEGTPAVVIQQPATKQAQTPINPAEKAVQPTPTAPVAPAKPAAEKQKK